MLTNQPEKKQCELLVVVVVVIVFVVVNIMLTIIYNDFQKGIGAQQDKQESEKLSRL